MAQYTDKNINASAIAPWLSHTARIIPFLGVLGLRALFVAMPYTVFASNNSPSDDKVALERSEKKRIALHPQGAVRFSVSICNKTLSSLPLFVGYMSQDDGCPDTFYAHTSRRMSCDVCSMFHEAVPLVVFNKRPLM